MPNESKKKRRRLKKSEYRCATCEGVFKKGLTDEEALKELKDRHPETPVEECALVCDDCFNLYFNEMV
jgi:PHP family Zn ribbon phosphoesterase